MTVARNSAYEMFENVRNDRDHWRETVRNLYDMLHVQPDVTAMELVAIIEARHAAFFGAQHVIQSSRDDTPQQA